MRGSVSLTAGSLLSSRQRKPLERRSLLLVRGSQVKIRDTVLPVRERGIVGQGREPLTLRSYVDPGPDLVPDPDPDPPQFNRT
jgi:hypothetical protein